MTLDTQATRSVTVQTPINIAFIKYWGKVDEELIVPTNDSFSITLSTARFRTKTTVAANPGWEGDRLWLNGEEVALEDSPRLRNVLAAARKGMDAASASHGLRIVSENNFPTAAGMASSAAGLSALAYALTKLFSLQIDATVLARIGSGSACRSIYGGFVKWVRGSAPDRSDCVAVQHATHEAWPEMNIFCLVTRSDRKTVPSTAGMRRASTSPLFQDRVAVRVPERMALASKAITAKDFETFAAVTMADCEDFRSVCRSSQPPVDYWNPTTEAIIALVKSFNDHHNRLKLAYTYDAGPNAFLFCEECSAPAVLAFFLRYFPTPEQDMYLESPTLLSAAHAEPVPEPLQGLLPGHNPTPLSMVLHSSVGSGPATLPETEGLVNLADGVPKTAGC